MKKLISGLLALVMLLSLSAVAFAAPYTLEEAGATVDVPDGMTAAEQPSEGGFVLELTVEGNEALRYAYFLGYAEEMEGKQISDLSEEEGQQLVQSVGQSMQDPMFQVVERDGVPVLIVESADATFGHMIILVDGWICDVAVGKNDGVALTEEEINVAAELLMSIQWNGGEEE